MTNTLNRAAALLILGVAAGAIMPASAQTMGPAAGSGTAFEVNHDYVVDSNQSFAGGMTAHEAFQGGMTGHEVNGAGQRLNNNPTYRCPPRDPKYPKC